MNKDYGSGYLITALGGGVALVCLALGFQLLSPELPASLAAWMEDGRLRNGLILALGGAMLSFLLGSGFMIAARRTLESSRRRRGGNPATLDGPALGQLLEAGTRLGRAGQELATLAANPKPGQDSLERMNQAVVQLRETLQQAEAIVTNINEIGGFPEKPDPGMD